MASAQAKHPSYLHYSDVGFVGTFTILEWFSDLKAHAVSDSRAHVVIRDLGWEPMGVVCRVRSEGDRQAVPVAGQIRVLVKDFVRRTCIVEVSEICDGATPVKMTWLLDDKPEDMRPAACGEQSVGTMQAGAGASAESAVGR